MKCTTKPAGRSSSCTVKGHGHPAWGAMGVTSSGVELAEAVSLTASCLEQSRRDICEDGKRAARDGDYLVPCTNAAGVGHAHQ